ncbi:MAG: histidinol-phosphatase [Clostridia bacterium]|nr:histidinol-phosphatase [Clostridia bacterium]
MIANYHSHTTRCHHATGTQREYIERAIQAGFQIWGFSDHTPYPFPGEYVSTFRMLPADLESYVEETLRLKVEYQGQIEIHLGLEAEYYPDLFEGLLRLCEGYPIEYMILGQHALKNEYDGLFSGRETAEEATLKLYCDQVSEGIATGKFLYVAHPDLINYVGPEAIYEKHIRRLLRAMKEHHVPGEINFLGLMEGRNYPNPRFWKLAGEEGIDVIFGADAHHTEHVFVPGVEERAKRLAEENHLHVLEKLPL